MTAPDTPTPGQITTLDDTITLPVNLLVQFMASHSRLSQAEYHRNPAYSDAHPAYIAEDDMCNYLISHDQAKFGAIMDAMNKENLP